MTLSTTELEDLRLTTQRFVRERLQPWEDWVETNDRRPDTWPELCREAVDLGLYAAHVPSEFGGSGLTLAEQVVLWEEFGHVSWPLTYLYSVPNLALLQCNDAQRELYLDPVVAGKRLQCFALTEPSAGSDVYAMRTQARRVPGGYVLNGSKHFISRASEADFAIVFAVTEPASGRARPGVTAFLIDADSPGYVVGARQRMMGWSGLVQNEITLSDCYVDDAHVLGAPGRGLALGLDLIAHARMIISAYCIGFMDRLIALCVDFARNRNVFGSAMAEKQGIQWAIAEMAVDVYTTRQVVRSTALALDAGKATVADVSKVKYFATRAVGRVADAAVQLHGGSGWCRDLPIERMYRDARVFRLIDGTDEVHKGMIWRGLAATTGTRPAT